jgi:methyl-accepting chemotaxis protein
MCNQALGAEQINEAMVQLTNGTRQAQAALEEFTKAASHLGQAVEVLNRAVAQFSV